MRLVPTEEERDLATMLRSLLATHCTPEAVRRLREPDADRFPVDLWKAMVDAGCVGLAVPEEYGGSGGSLTDVGIWHVEAGRSLAPTVLHGTIHLGLALLALADEDQKVRHLPALCSGGLRGTVAVGNPYDARDVRPRFTATPIASTAEGGTSAWEIDGVVDYVPDADLAERVLLTATEDIYGQPGRTLGVLLDPAAAGVQMRPLTTNTGDRWQSVTLDRVRVEAPDVLVGPEGRGLSLEDLRRVSLTVVALLSLDMVGGVEAVLERTVDHTTSRHQFGRPIGAFQAAQHLVADIHIAAQCARLAGHSAVFWLDRGHPAVRQVAVAVITASTAYRRATLDAHQLHGGMGYVLETDLHLWSERARELAALGGCADTAASWLEEEVL